MEVKDKNVQYTENIVFRVKICQQKITNVYQTNCFIYLFWITDNFVF